MLAPGATIGILGGGQLGRMLAIAAAQLGFRAHVFAPEADSPAFEVAASHTVGAYEDEAALIGFARAVDVVTTEFENVPSRTLGLLAGSVAVHPSAEALAITQDRLFEKELATRLAIPTPAHAALDAHDLDRALSAVGVPAVLKTRRLGYDGKGQAKIMAMDQAAAAHASLGHAPAIIERLVPFDKEVSVVAARGIDGAFAAWDVVENRHANHILATSIAPADIPPALAARAVDTTRAIGEALGFVGVFAVEFFVVADQLLFNEIAPRVHNSGHWTIEGAATSQFTQAIRAIAGWPLGSTRRLGRRVVMDNLIGDDVARAPEIAARPGASLHLYGKREARPGRKMGHVTVVEG